MQNNASDPLDLDNRMMISEQYNIPTPPAGVTWSQLHEARANIKSEQMAK